jgi:hypothetical protein
MSAARRHNMAVFLKKYGNELAAAVNNEPIFFSAMWAQSCNESGYGSSSAAKNKNNFFGILAGNTTRRFQNPQEAFSYQVELLKNTNLPYVAHGVLKANSPYEQIRAIADSGYYSMTNDSTLGGNNVVKGTVWNGYTWNGNKWAGSNFTSKQSADHYYNVVKGFIDDALAILPIGKINVNGLAQVQTNISNLNINTIA